jgi:4-alpha-glucanotransferase
MMVHAEDLLGAAEQVNLPATTDEHPNWRRKLPLAVEDFAASERLERVVRAIRERR